MVVKERNEQIHLTLSADRQAIKNLFYARRIFNPNCNVCRGLCHGVWHCLPENPSKPGDDRKRNEPKGQGKKVNTYLSEMGYAAYRLGYWAAVSFPYRHFNDPTRN